MAACTRPSIPTATSKQSPLKNSDSIHHQPPAHSIPSTFFANRCNTPSDSDFAIMRRKLRSALYMPSRKRWIADWLFVNSETCFHPNIILPPESFSNSVAIQTSHSSTSNAPPPPVLPEIFQRLHPHLIAASHKPGIKEFVSTTDCAMLYVPVANIDSHTVGYCFLAGAIEATDGNTISPTHFFARFAYDASRNDLLVVVTSRTSSDRRPHTVLLRSGPADDGGRDFSAFACLENNFSFENLPNTALSMTDATPEVPIPLSSDSPHPKRPNHVAAKSTDPIVSVGNCDSSLHVLDNLDVTDEWLSSKQVIDGAPVSPAYKADSSHMPWIVAETSCTTDGVGIPRRPGKSGTASGAFDGENLQRSLLGIQELLAGSIECRMYAKTFEKREELDVCLGPKFKASFTVSKDRQVNMLYAMAIQEYYSAILHVPTKEHLLMPDNESGEDLLSVPTKRRRRKCEKWDSDGTGSDGTMVQLSRAEVVQMEERKEAQRRRNRVSAARSYEKKKRLRMQQARGLSNAT